MKIIYEDEYKGAKYRLICNYDLADRENIFIFEKSTDKDSMGDYNWERINFLPFIIPIKDKPEYNRIFKIVNAINESQHKFDMIKNGLILE
ncbi:hypothetical protein M0R19_07910 [Candidatus Pacearchaeota archaeon]|jgi:hypothetical protein|nr:hypothetical protein [bacterium]MCK9597082.1 hypothetical protein [Candidatus Pacearchaeota archaeon]